MSTLQPDGNANKLLTRDSFTSQGELVSKEDELSVVVESAIKAETWIQNKQWTLLWRDSDILYSSPRPLSVYEGSYVLEPSVVRYTVAKVVQSIVPQLHKGLFYEDPPMVLRPRGAVSQMTTDAKRAVFAALLEEANFKRECRYGIEQMVHLGTCIFKWGIERKTINVPTRRSTKKIIDTGMGSESISLEEAPNITDTEVVVTRPTFEYRDIRDVLVDPHCELPDIREAAWVIDRRYVDFYQILELAKDPDYDIPEDVIDLWFPPSEEPARTSVNTATMAQGFVHHAEDQSIDVSGDPLRKKLEVLEFWDAQRCIVALNRKRVIKTKKNEFKQVPFLSANFWNRPKALYGIGTGVIVGQNQRIDQGVINSIIKLLSFSASPVYLRQRDSNAPTQMIRTGIGKVLTVDGDPGTAYRLLEQPKVDPNLWNALRESQQATESATGADQMLVGGSTAGPRTSMGRTAGGAGILAGASATRLEGPLGNFIDQVFQPFLYILDELVFRNLPDHEIESIVGQELGKAFEFDLNEFHSAKYEYEVLAGASMSAKKTMAQSLMLITQMFENPQLQAQLADINGEYIDFKPILRMWMEASEWKNVEDIIKPLTPEMKQRRLESQQQNAKLAQQMALKQQDFQNKQVLEDQASTNREKRDVIRQAMKSSELQLAVTGEPGGPGIGAYEGNPPVEE